MWREKRTDLEHWQATLDDISQREKLPQLDFTPFTDGSAAVFGADEIVIKIYHPDDSEDCQREEESLNLLAGKLDIDLPKVLAAGTVDESRYLVMSRLAGDTLKSRWKEIPKEQKKKLVAKLGEVTKQLHKVQVPNSSIIKVDSSAFIKKQINSAKKRQAECKLPHIWLEQIDEFLAPLKLPEDGAFLHTELMRDHLLVTETDGKWQFSGLFDFAESMTLPTEYEFASVGLFVTGGDAELLRHYLLAYGYEESALNFDFSRRLLAFTLLHRYANLSWYLSFLAPAVGATKLDDLARRWFSM